MAKYIIATRFIFSRVFSMKRVLRNGFLIAVWLTS